MSISRLSVPRDEKLVYDEWEQRGLEEALKTEGPK